MKTLKKLWTAWERLIGRILCFFWPSLGRHNKPSTTSSTTYEVVRAAGLIWRAFLRRPILVVGSMTLIILIPALILSFKYLNKAQAAWYNDSWLYRTALTINNSGAADSNKKVKFDIDTATLYSAGKIQIDCDDSRFTDANGKLLQFYLDSANGACNTNSTDYYVLMPTINAGTTTIYHYYGNPSAIKGSQNSQFSQATFTQDSTTANSEEQSPGPVGYWKFDEGTGQTANDSSTSRNAGTLGTSSSAPTWQTEDMCVSGKCLKFDGSNDYVDMGNNSSLNITTNFTAEAWIKWNGSGSAYQRIVTKESVFYLGLHNGILSGAGGNGSSWNSFGDANTTLSSNNWHHVAITISNGAFIFYLDGKPDKTKTSAINGSNSNTVKIGGELGEFFNGFLDEVKIYPYARTAAQIKLDYNAGKARAGAAKGVAAGLGANKTNLPDVLSNGLVGYWKQDEATWSGTLNEVIDSSGNGNHGQAQGAAGGKAYPSAGKFGNGGYFDGVDDYVDMGNPASLNITGNQITIEAWIKPDSISGYRAIVAKITPTTSYVLLTNGSEIYSAIYTPSLIVNNSSGCGLSIGTWSHIVHTYDGSYTRIYCNGKLVGTSALGTGNISSSPTSPFTIGYQSTSYPRYFSGQIDDVRIYNRSLSPAEVRQLYNWAPGPVASYDFEDASGTTVSDKSGNSNTGTWYGTGPSHYAQGKLGKAGKFNGSDDYVYRASAPTTLTTIWTLEAWIKPTQLPQLGMVVYNGSSGAGGYGIGIGTSNGTSGSKLIALFGGINWYDSGYTLSNNVWQHIVLARDGTTARFYVNGVQTSNTISTTPGTVYSNFTVGADIVVAFQHYFNGQIDDVKIYNYARSAKQIVEDMNAGHPAVGSPVGSAVGYWKFDEGYGTTANNSGNGGSTYKATLASSTNTPVWTNNGKLGKALEFGSDGDYATINTNLPTLTEGTLEMWVKRTATTGTYQMIFTDSGSQLEMCWNGTTTLTFYVNNVALNTTSASSLNAWYHLVGTFSETGNYQRIYVNGVLANSSTYPGDATTATRYFGSRAGSYPLTGSIDEIKVYNYPLTEDEVKLDYNKGSAIVLGSLSDTSGLTGGSVASQSASAEYCIPGDTATCTAPVGRWDFEDQAQLGSVQDTSGNGNTGTWAGTGATHWATGKIGKAGKFNGSNDYVNVPDSTSLDSATAQVTLSAWIYPTSTTNYRTVIGKNYSTQWWFGLYVGTTRLQIWLKIGGTARQLISNRTLVSLNQWNHIVGTYNGAKVILYVNGNVDTSWDYSGALSTDATKNLYIGADREGSTDPTYYFSGQIDDVKIYNYARTPAQIAWDYSRGKPVGHWKFDECQGTVANDSGGSGVTGGNKGTITIGATVPQTSAGTCTDGLSTSAWYNGRNGKYNASLNFDGVDDYTQVSDTANLRFDANTADFSLFTWVKRTTTGTEYIISKEDADNDGYRLMFNSSNQVLCSEDATDVTSSSTIADTNWHLIGCTIDRDGNGQVYIDGKADGAAVAMGTDAMATTSNIRIATRSYTSTNYFNGQIDDIKIFNYALTAAQVKLLYNNSSAVYFGPASGNP